MKLFFTIALLVTLSVGACTTPDLEDNTTQNKETTKPTEEESDSNPPELLMEQATPQLQTTLELAYIALEDNGENGPLVGCGDSEILVEKSTEGRLNATERVTQALNFLLTNDSQYYGESGLYNALYSSKLTVDSVLVTSKAVTVKISGTTMLGGVCDNPRFVDQIEATVRNNLDTDTKPILNITVNGKDIHDFQNESGK